MGLFDTLKRRARETYKDYTDPERIRSKRFKAMSEKERELDLREKEAATAEREYKINRRLEKTRPKNTGGGGAWGTIARIGENARNMDIIGTGSFGAVDIIGTNSHHRRAGPKKTKRRAKRKR